MIEVKPDLIPRREFLRSAAVVAGTLTLGLEVGSAQAAAYPAAACPAAPALSAAYWNGQRLIDARHLATGDPALAHSGACIKVLNHRGGTEFQALNAHFPVLLDGSEQYAPFHAWTGNPEHPIGASFTLPVESGIGILLSALHGGTETFCRLHSGSSLDQPKLRTGLYVLAIGQPHWNLCHFDPHGLQSCSGPLSRRTLGGLQAAEFGYRLISIEAV